MTPYCSATIDTRRRAPAMVRLFAAGLLLAAAWGAVRAEGVGETPRVPLAVSAVDADGATLEDSSAAAAGMNLTWQPRRDLGLRAEFRALTPVLDPSDGRACGAGLVSGCDPVRPGALPTRAAGGGRQATLGGAWQPLDGLRVGVDLHSRQPGELPPGALLLPRVLDFIAPGWEDSLSRGVEDGEAVDLSVAYGFDAGVIGELELQVELSHVLNQNLESVQPTPGAALGLVGQPENQASVGFNWSRGDFSGSVSSHYTDGIMLNGRVHPAAWTTVDINFAWRTPWNASLSLGAQNFLGQERGRELGVDASTPPELDSAFSRVPYVRYEQDL